MSYKAIDIYEFIKQVLVKIGMSEADASIVADSLVKADLEGNGSHGMSRLPIYAKRLLEGRIAVRPRIGFELHGAILRVDGDNGLGQVVSCRALEKALPVAREHGIAGMFVNNSNHFGTAAYFCQQACARNMALIAMTNSPPGIPPWGGKRAFLGTNPIAFGFPVRDAPPVIVDMSSSVVARGKIMLADKQGDTIPTGWAIDENGMETTDPAAALRGSVLPLGGAKGYALAMAVEMMCSILSGAAFGPHVNNLYKDGDPAANVGHCFILMDMSRWMDMEQYFAIMQSFLEEIKAVPTAAGTNEIFYPGERRYAQFISRQQEGIQVSGEVVQELIQLGEAVGVEFPDGGMSA